MLASLAVLALKTAPSPRSRKATRNTLSTQIPASVAALARKRAPWARPLRLTDSLKREIGEKGCRTNTVRQPFPVAITDG